MAGGLIQHNGQMANDIHTATRSHDQAHPYSIALQLDDCTERGLLHPHQSHDQRHLHTKDSTTVAGWLLLADGKEAFLNGVALGLGEGAAFGQPVDGMQRGVDERGVVFRAGKLGSTAGQQRQHR